MTSPIIDFIEARLAEDEATAMAAEGANWGQRRDRMNPYVIHDVDAYKPGILYTGRIIAAEKLETRDHIVRHDPARVLREVAAKRAILALNLPPVSCDHAHPQYDVYHPDGHGPHPAYRALAQPYSNHPNYRKEWAA